MTFATTRTIINDHAFYDSNATPSALGRRLHHDSRNKNFPVRLATPWKRNVRHAMNAPHVDQFYLSACVGFSTVNLLNTTAAARSRLAFNRRVIDQGKGFSFLGNNDGVRCYREATLRDPFPGSYPPVDEGSSAIGIMRWLKEVGIIKSYSWTDTFDSFLAALERQPVLIGSNWYDDMMSTGTDGIIHSSASGPGGGHEYCATQINWGRRLIGCEQSWGEGPPGFGQYGRFFLSFDLAEELIIKQQGDVAVPELL